MCLTLLVKRGDKGGKNQPYIGPVVLELHLVKFDLLMLKIASLMAIVRSERFRAIAVQC
jgi:hypothetical protein